MCQAVRILARWQSLSFGRIGTHSIAAVEASKFLFENRFTKTKVDISKIFDDRFVKAHLAKVRGK
jgi:hypothetical protein